LHVVKKRLFGVKSNEILVLFRVRRANVPLNRGKGQMKKAGVQELPFGGAVSRPYFATP